MKKIYASLVLSIVVMSLSSQPVITSNPQNKTNCVDSCVYLRVKAVGTGLTYQWQRDAGNGFLNLTIPTSLNDTLWVCDTAVVVPISMDYRCVVVDVNNDSATSNVASISTDSCLAPIADFTYTLAGSEICFTNTSMHATSILWNFGDGHTASAQAPCNDYGTAWIYDVSLYVFNDYGSDTLTRTIDMVGVNELSSHFKMFPNPVVDQFYVYADVRIDGYYLTDMQGQLVDQKTNTGMNLIINMSDFPQGIYHLVIESDNKTVNQKVVKN